MRTLGTLLAAAAVVDMTLGAVPAEAHYWNHGPYRGEHWNGHHRNGAGVALGILGGMIAGAAIASAANQYQYSYSYPYYGYVYR